MAGNVLLILSTSKTSDEAIDFAVGEAKKASARLVILYVLEKELTDELFDKFSDVGFIGDKPSEELAEAVMKEYRRRAYEEIGKAQIKAMEENVGFDALTVQGDYVEEALKAIVSYDIGLAVALKRKQSFVTRYFSRSVTDELSAKAGCKVHVFEEKA